MKTKKGIFGWVGGVIGFEEISDVGTDMLDSMTPKRPTNQLAHSMYHPTTTTPFLLLL
jgi:hypothetical protein